MGYGVGVLAAAALILRAYQSAQLDQLRQHMRRGVKRVLLQGATGSGKTSIASAMIHGAEGKGRTSWFVVHRAELVEQSVAALREVGCRVGVVAAGYPLEAGRRTQVCSVQSLARRRARLPKPDLIVWDEAGHCAAATWQNIHAAYSNSYHVGLDATPERLDGRALSPYFDEIVLGPSVRWLIDNGYLCDYRLFDGTASSGLDMTGVHTMAGDFNKKEAAARLDGSRIVGNAVAHYRKHCPGARAVVFAWSVSASRDIADAFITAGIPAAHLDGSTPREERRRIIADFRAGVVRVLVNVDIVGEGFDLPAVEAVFLLTPTQSRRKHLQQIGRGLRVLPGKDKALIFDHAGNTARLDLLPDDEIEWSLDGRERSGKRDSEPSVRICGECFAAGRTTDRACRVCGAIFPIQEREITVEAGELAEVDPEVLRQQRTAEQREARDLDSLIALGRSRGYVNPAGWARHLMRARGQRQ